MKTFLNVLKILAILAAIAAAVYVAIAYGDKIVAWFKKNFSFLCRKKRYYNTQCDFDYTDAASTIQAEDADFAG